jgi:hypothetical protein
LPDIGFWLCVSLKIYLDFGGCLKQGKRLLGRPRRRWEDGISMDFGEIEDLWSGFIWLRIGTGGGLL